jgi:hypothetical protein
MTDLIRQRLRHLFPHWVGVMLALHLSACQPSSHKAPPMDPVLPFGLTLEADPGFQGGYTIRETDGFALVGKGVSYRDIDLQVEALVGYGVQPSAIAAEVIDQHGETKFIRVTALPSPSKQPFRVGWATASEVKGSSAYQWVALKSEQAPAP